MSENNKKTVSENNDASLALKGLNNTLQPREDYNVITDLNLFHPERKFIKEEESVDLKLKDSNDFVLYGTMLTDEGGIAYIEEKRSGKKKKDGESEKKTVRTGDEINGYIVKSITLEEVELRRDDVIVIVSVNDPTKERKKLPKKKPASNKKSSAKNEHKNKRKSKDKKKQPSMQDIFKKAKQSRTSENP